MNAVTYGKDWYTVFWQSTTFLQFKKQMNFLFVKRIEHLSYFYTFQDCVYIFILNSRMFEEEMLP